MKRTLRTPMRAKTSIMAAVIVVAVVFGSAVKLSSHAAAVVGDLNKDNTVNVLDLSLLLANWGKAGVGDINADGVVNVFDLSTLLNNWGKTATATPTPTVAPTATPVPVVYCSGLTPCYGPSTMAQHTSVTGSCWGYNLTWVIDLTAFAPDHPAGPSNILSSVLCGKDISSALSGNTNVSGTHNHNTDTKNNTANSILSSYRVGYYDASKP